MEQGASAGSGDSGGFGLIAQEYLRSKAVRQDLSRQAAKSRARGGTPGHNLEDRTRQDLYEVAKRKDIAGRSRMGKWELIDAIRRGS